MKIFNIIKQVILILSFVFAGLSFVLGGITLDPESVTFSVALISFMFFGFIGFFLFNSSNDVARKIGLGLTTGFMVVEFYFSVSSISATNTSAYIGLISVILYVVYFLVTFIGFIALGSNQTDDPETDPKIKKILGGKKLQENGIISAQEYKEKRQMILGIKPKNK